MNRFIFSQSGPYMNRQDSAGYALKAASNGRSSEKAPEELVRLHKQAVDGDKEAVKKAYELAKKMYDANPRSQLAEAYMGSTTSLLGRDAIDPNERFNLALEGVKRLDKAVSQDPHNTEVRVLRGYVCFKLPELYFHQTMTAIEDFKYLVERHEQNKDTLSPDFYCQLLYDLGSAYKTMGNDLEGEKNWNKLLSVTNDPKYHNLVGNTGAAYGLTQSGYDSWSQGQKKNS